MNNIIVGTAGHIDHGKTALVGALTGVDTDRLKEEKQRGISIDLGFAHLDLERDLRIGFIDVPGHERFIKNMLAGVGGIDLVLFVIAADESIKPQTREHFEICRLLKIPRGIVVLTKSDLVDADILELVRLEVDEFVRGSFLENAPVIAVSAVTGAGLSELRDQLRRTANEIADQRLSGKDPSGYFRLPIDRAFAMRGFGAVVTGTVISGAVNVEQDVELFPQRRKLRVRGLQTHGSAVRKASAGQRTAVNLAGVEHTELHRGMLLAEAGRFAAATLIDCSFELLRSAKPLKNRAPVHFHAGTAEVEAETRLLDGAERVEPGARAYVRIALREPLLLLPGDRFIVRMFSPVITIGGGVVLDAAPPRRRASDRLKTLEQGNPAERVALLVAESKHGMDLATLIARTGLLEADIRAAAKSPDLIAIFDPQFWLLDARTANGVLESIQQTLKRFHRDHPLLPGMPKEEIRSRLLPEAPPFLLDVLLARAKTIAVKGELVHLTSHKVALKQDEEEASARIEAAFQNAGLAVPATPDVLAKSGVEAGRAKTILQILLRDKKLVRVGEDLVFHASAVATLRGMLAGRKGERFSVPEFKDWTGISRKYAIPLLEYLDRERVTRRDGEARVVL
jgi:selenocysteine-specific elongation factor